MTQSWRYLWLRKRTRFPLTASFVSIALVLATPLDASADADPNPGAVVVTWQTEEGRPVAGQKIVLMAGETPESGDLVHFVPVAKAVTDTAGAVRFDALTAGRRYMINPGYPFNDINWGWTARPGVTESFVLPAIPLDKLAIWSRGAEARWVKDDKYGYALLKGITWNCFAPASMPADAPVHLTITDDFGAILLNNVDGYTCPSGSAGTWGGSTSHTCGVLPAFTQPPPSNPTWMYHPSYPEHEIHAITYTWTVDTPDGPYTKSTTVPVDASICPPRSTPAPATPGTTVLLGEVRHLRYRTSPRKKRSVIVRWKSPVFEAGFDKLIRYEYKYARESNSHSAQWSRGTTRHPHVKLTNLVRGRYRIIVRPKIAIPGMPVVRGAPDSIRIHIH